MNKTVNIVGMTCGGCVAGVEEKLGEIRGVISVKAYLDKGEVSIDSKTIVSIQDIRNALPAKYSLSEKELSAQKTKETSEGLSKRKQLKPLFLILIYISLASNLIEYNDWSFKQVMLNYMGLFYIVFSFFKFLDLKGFPDSFKMYDPIAKKINGYGWLYPFIETILGLMFLFRYK